MGWKVRSSVATSPSILAILSPPNGGASETQLVDPPHAAARDAWGVRRVSVGVAPVLPSMRYVIERTALSVMSFTTYVQLMNTGEYCRLLFCPFEKTVALAGKTVASGGVMLSRERYPTRLTAVWRRVSIALTAVWRIVAHDTLDGVLSRAHLLPPPSYNLVWIPAPALSEWTVKRWVGGCVVLARCHLKTSR